MKIKDYERFRQAYQELPSEIRKKADRQLSLLTKDMYYP